MQHVPLGPTFLCGYLFVSVTVAAIYDLKYRRIFNVLTFSIIIVALSIHSFIAGLPGLFFCLKGLGLGFILLIFPYLLGGMGAGDVKLMAAVGAVLGVEHTLLVFLLTAILGGLTALVMMAARGEFFATLRRIGVMLYGLCSGVGLESCKVDRASLKHHGIPYGAVIAAGTYCFFAYRWLSGQGLPLPAL